MEEIEKKPNKNIDKRSGCSNDYLDTDAKVLKEASNIQNATRASIQRMQARAAEAQEVGATTLQELHEQRRQLHRIQDEGDRLKGQLKTSERLQNILSRWSLNFNGRAARRQAQTETEHEKRQQKLKEKRRQITKEYSTPKQLSQVTISDLGCPSHEPRDRIISLHDRNESDDSKLSRMEGPAAEDALQLQQLEEEDVEIDRELDKVGTQLDDILEMAEIMGSETKSHATDLNNFTDQMTELNYEQRVINNRTGRFLSGRVRRQYESESAKNPTGFW